LWLRSDYRSIGRNAPRASSRAVLAIFSSADVLTEFVSRGSRECQGLVKGSACSKECQTFPAYLTSTPEQAAQLLPFVVDVPIAAPRPRFQPALREAPTGHASVLLGLPALFRTRGPWGGFCANPPGCGACLDQALVLIGRGHATRVYFNVCSPAAQHKFCSLLDRLRLEGLRSKNNELGSIGCALKGRQSVAPRTSRGRE